MFIASRSAYSTCRSEPARDSGGSANLFVDFKAIIASRLTPTVGVGLLVLCVALLLSACSSRPPLPEKTPTLALPLQLHIERLQAEQRQDWVLVIQQEGPAVRWSMMDLLGIPQARQKLVKGEWQADGLLPPNPEARELFAALLFALTPKDELAANYPVAWQHGAQRSFPERWDVRYALPMNFELNLPKGPKYHVTSLSGEAP